MEKFTCTHCKQAFTDHPMITVQVIDESKGSAFGYYCSADHAGVNIAGYFSGQDTEKVAPAPIPVMGDVVDTQAFATAETTEADIQAVTETAVAPNPAVTVAAQPLTIILPPTDQVLVANEEMTEWLDDVVPDDDSPEDEPELHLTGAVIVAQQAPPEQEWTVTTEASAEVEETPQATVETWGTYFLQWLCGVESENPHILFDIYGIEKHLDDLQVMWEATELTPLTKSAMLAHFLAVISPDIYPEGYQFKRPQVFGNVVAVTAYDSKQRLMVQVSNIKSTVTTMLPTAPDKTIDGGMVADDPPLELPTATLKLADIFNSAKEAKLANA